MFMGLRLTEVEKITGLTGRQIHFYVKNCEIMPRARRATSARGVRFEYLPDNIIELSVIKQLADFGITVSKIKKIIDSFSNDPKYSDSYNKEFPYLYIFNDDEGEFVVEFRKDKLTDSAIRKFPSHIMIDYKRITDKVLSK
jgi:DNA-binding transcriptional MerR regulator